MRARAGELKKRRTSATLLVLVKTTRPSNLAYMHGFEDPFTDPACFHTTAVSQDLYTVSLSSSSSLCALERELTHTLPPTRFLSELSCSLKRATLFAGHDDRLGASPSKREPMNALPSGRAFLDDLEHARTSPSSPRLGCPASS